MDMSKMDLLVSTIRANNKLLNKFNYNDVQLYCVNVHNEAHGILKTIAGFIEKNFDIFDPGMDSWAFRSRDFHTNYIGFINPYNCVVRDIDFEKDTPALPDARIYWIDDGIMFQTVNGKVVYVSYMRHPEPHGENGPLWNTRQDYVEANYFPRFKDGLMPTDWIWEDFKEDKFVNCTEFSMHRIKKCVESDLEYANKVMEKLAFSLKKINDSLLKRISKNEELKRTLHNKIVKYTIEISKVEI